MGTEIKFDDRLSAVCIEKHRRRNSTLLNFRIQDYFYRNIEKIGHAPLPPYIKDDEEAQYAKYQTVYAKIDGSAAAPTAGFTLPRNLNIKIKAKGIEIVDYTSRWTGTFRPVSALDTNDHMMHHEYYMIGEKAAETLRLKPNGRRIIAS